MDELLLTWSKTPLLSEGDSGGYYVWTSSKTPLLSETKLGAGKLLLHPLGFAIPHYANSSKIGFVLEDIFGA
ncbi:glutelin type-A [Tanacetum coccineum]